ncbi:HEAT repeat domain-containing protein [Desulfonema limicola]|uniref:HEAT repeat domain-containing protein n=1 Tax=Desulfonema limicola TaxID=45656 RepID=UPI001A9AD8D1|nr:hypothetical protein [Desulfonema limicola]
MTLKLIITGVISSQIISLVHVYISNTQYFYKLSAIRKAGYLVVPNLIVMEKLKSIGPAFFGAFFFTFTVGTCLTILSLSAAWTWDRIFSRHNIFFIPIALFWSGCLVLLNINGFSPMASIQFIFVPFAVFSASIIWFSKTPENKNLENKTPENKNRPFKARIIIHFICIAALAFMGTSRMNSSTFSLIRDNFLLSNKAGISLNNFYYTYTLYAAQVFKSLNQDMLRTCRISSPGGLPVSRALKRTLINYDYLVINTDDYCDLELEYSKNAIKMSHKGKEIINTTEQEFLKNPGKMLKSFSQKCDHNVFFRQFTFISLLLVSGLFCYLVLYMLFKLMVSIVLGKYLKGFSGFMVTIICCLITGAAVFYFWHPEKPKIFKKENLARALKSENADTRIAALKFISARKIDIGKIGIPPQMPASPIILERYWLAKALYSAGSPESFEINLALLEDPQINVSYIAFNSLGQKKSKDSVREILKQIKILEQWYVQLYAYKSLRRLNWRQTGLQ